MAASTGFDFLAELGGCDTPLRGAGFRVTAPCHAVPVIKDCQQTFLRIVFPKRPPALLLLSPGNMARALSMAGFAPGADFLPGSGEAICRGIIVLAHVGRVALRAHEVPVLVQFRPVQDVVVRDCLVWIEVEPALAPIFLWTAVPGER